MSEPDQLQTFIVYLADENPIRRDFLSIDAYTVWNMDGDLVFTGPDGVIVDMIAKGHWMRCKTGKVE